MSLHTNKLFNKNSTEVSICLIRQPHISKSESILKKKSVHAKWSSGNNGGIFYHLAHSKAPLVISFPSFIAKDMAKQDRYVWEFEYITLTHHTRNIPDALHPSLVTIKNLSWKIMKITLLFSFRLNYSSFSFLWKRAWQHPRCTTVCWTSVSLQWFQLDDRIINETEICLSTLINYTGLSSYIESAVYYFIRLGFQCVLHKK